MERLTIRGNKENILLKGNGCTYDYQSYNYQVEEEREKLKAALEKLAMYEDLEEKGLFNQACVYDIEKVVEQLEKHGQKMSEAKSNKPYGKASASCHNYYKAISVKKAKEIVRAGIKMAIKNYNPNIHKGVHTIRVTIQRWDYVGHIIKKIYGNCKGKSILDFDFDEEDADVENDCNLKFDEDEEIFSAVLTNEGGNTLEVEGTARDFNKMIVATEIINYEEEKNETYC